MLAGILGALVPCCLDLSLAHQYGECLCMPLLPGSTFAIRVGIRERYKIRVSVCNHMQKKCEDVLLVRASSVDITIWPLRISALSFKVTLQITINVTKYIHIQYVQCDDLLTYSYMENQ